MNHSNYVNPLTERYASKEMMELFSPFKKFSTWRKLWVALAETEKELGLNITDEQIEEMRNNINNIDFEYAKEMEKKFRHDVMAHVHTFGKVCPKAMPIIHLGATSAYVGDNTDLILMKEGLTLIKKQMVNLVHNLKEFALKYKDLPTLGFTHFQPAQLTTVGKRACLWLQDFLLDFEDLEYVSSNLKFRGVKGTTGTQASFLALFNGDHEKVRMLDRLVSKKMGFDKVLTITGQTYTRKQDTQVLKVLAGIAESAHKMATDIRLLQNLKEVEEPFEKHQIGSSAMAYKRNPMRSERVCSLARLVITNSINPYLTHATQWFERTLDDSANRRVVIPESFLAIDAILQLLINITDGLVVYNKIIEKHIMEELPFMATENIIMESVKRGADRQKMHELIRKHSMDAGMIVKMEGGKNDLLERLAKDENIPLNKEEILKIVNPADFIGRAPQQVEEFVNDEVNPILNKYKDLLGVSVEIKV
ncbi:adenylosuccinate lyase [Calditerrivibrio nitroreducens]|uniref:Adenylosuccinate lyase n=1 Tax=Calditerrivibrio nitroreducens (strain DSM 19672 / NBRC 101217 / Yu37-1) TaxID=768670 RepID=E4TIF2_CALNY|nr:adenylosuccinate lyase [Calditerrivibrio nitroreducens]ADR17977.1 adenylosuccinate lyase [Calditerrivibrio nitroreducens DSM 19672]